MGTIRAVWGAAYVGDARRASSSRGDAWVYGLVDIPERRGNERLRVVRKEPVSDQQSVRSRSLVDASLKMRGTKVVPRVFFTRRMPAS